MQNRFQYVHMFGLDAKNINYIPGLRFAFVKERNPGQNGLPMSQKCNATIFFFKKSLHRELCPMSSPKYLFQEQLQHPK